MAQNSTVNVAVGAWAQLTNADTARITFQNTSWDVIFIKATVGAVAPSDLVGAIRYASGEGERNVLLSELFPGVTGANRVYTFAQNGAAVMVSHA